MKIKFNLAKVI